MKLVFASAASRDLLRLRNFIAKHDPVAASRIASDLRARITYLKMFPDMGREVSEAPAALPLREFAFGDYIARYVRLETSLAVLRVWHHFEDRNALE